MIISDEDDAQKIKDPPATAPTVRYPERAASRRPFSPLPDYETSQALAFRDLNESQVTLYKPPPRRRFLDSRLWRAAIISLVIYIFLTLVIGVPIIVQKEHDESEQKYPYNSLTYALSWPNNNSPSPYPGNISSPAQAGIIPVCNNWTAVEYFNGTSSPIVLAATEQYVSPNGQFSLTSNASCSGDMNSVQGAFYAGINPNQTVQDAVVSIVMQSSSPSIFDRSFVCFAVADNFTDLALYVPDNLAPTDNILYNITLLFPQTAIPSRVDSFATVLPMFDQRFSSFDGNVIFDSVSIEGAVSRVTVDYIQANRLLVDTSLEPVTGTFHANSSLLISTIMAPIVVNVSLYNDPKSQFPTTLDVHTGNGNLTADVTILAPNKNPPLRPNFVANFRTFSGSLSTNFLHDPTSPPTAVQLRVLNDLGPADVTLDNLFEGVFQVSTKQAAASVTQGNASVTDPWVPGLERAMVTTLNSTERIYGWIGWGNAETLWNAYQQGNVLIDSSLADVTLSFLG